VAASPREVQSISPGDIEDCFADQRDQRAFKSVMRIVSIIQMCLEATACRVETHTRSQRCGAADDEQRAGDWPHQNKDKSEGVRATVGSKQ
jgi:hypothetical protein